MILKYTAFCTSTNNKLTKHCHYNLLNRSVKNRNINCNNHFLSSLPNNSHWQFKNNLWNYFHLFWAPWLSKHDFSILQEDDDFEIISFWNWFVKIWCNGEADLYAPLYLWSKQNERPFYKWFEFVRRKCSSN